MGKLISGKVKGGDDIKGGLDENAAPKDLNSAPSNEESNREEKLAVDSLVKCNKPNDIPPSSEYTDSTDKKYHSMALLASNKKSESDDDGEKAAAANDSNKANIEEKDLTQDQDVNYQSTEDTNDSSSLLSASLSDRKDDQDSTNATDQGKEQTSKKQAIVTFPEQVSSSYDPKLSPNLLLVWCF